MQQYLQKAQRWAHRLGKIPTVEAVFLSGSLATGKATQASDIDLFVIVRPGTIWCTRAEVFVLLKIFRQLAKPDNHAGKICPNHFITSDNLELNEKNAYSAEMFSQNVPLYDPRNIFVEFAEANGWVREFGYTFQITNNKKQKPKTRYLIFDICSLVFVALAKLLEPFLKYPQKWKIERSKIFKKGGHGIFLEDTELRFHPILKSRSSDQVGG